MILSVCFVTGITDDDLRETAYEILLAAAGASGYLRCMLFYYILFTANSVMTGFHVFGMHNQGAYCSIKGKEEGHKV